MDETTRRDYLQQAHRLGHEFESSLAVSRDPALGLETIKGGVR